MPDDKFDIPESLRSMASQNVDQAKRAYEKFLDASRQAQELITKSSAELTSNAKQIQQKALEFAQTNTKAGFDLAERLAKAKTMQEAFDLQARYAQEQMEVYSRQAQELGRLVSEATKKASP